MSASDRSEHAKQARFLVHTAASLMAQIDHILTRAVGETKRAFGEESPAVAQARESHAALGDMRDAMDGWARMVKRGAKHLGDAAEECDPLA